MTKHDAMSAAVQAATTQGHALYGNWCRIGDDWWIICAQCAGWLSVAVDKAHAIGGSVATNPCPGHLPELKEQQL